MNPYIKNFFANVVHEYKKDPKLSIDTRRFPIEELIGFRTNNVSITSSFLEKHKISGKHAVKLIENELERKWELIHHNALPEDAPEDQKITHLRKKQDQILFLRRQVDLYELMNDLIEAQEIFRQIKPRFNTYPHLLQRIDHKIELLKGKIIKKIEK